MEGLRAVKVGEVEVHVPEGSVAGELLLGLVRNSQQPFEIQVVGADVQPAAWVLPFTARAVRIDLDAVSLRVVEVKRLADEVVGGAGERQALLERSPEETAQLLFSWQEDGEVEETGGVPGPPAPPPQGPLAEHGRAPGAQPGGGRAALRSALAHTPLTN